MADEEDLIESELSVGNESPVKDVIIKATKKKDYSGKLKFTPSPNDEN